MIITFVYSCAIFCDIYFKAKIRKDKSNLLILPTAVIIVSIGFILEVPQSGFFYCTIVSSFLIFTGLCLLGYSWIVLSLYLASKNNLINMVLKTIAAFPVIFILLVVYLNPIHHLLNIMPHDFNMTYSMLYYSILKLNALYIIIATIILKYNFIKNKKLPIGRKLIILSVLLYVNVYILIRILFKNSLELMPLFSVICFHIMIYSISVRYKLFDIIPSSISSLVQNMDQSILIVDTKQNIVSYNNSFKVAFGEKMDIKDSDTLGLFVNKLRELTCDDEDSQSILRKMLLKNNMKDSGKIHVKLSKDSWYMVFIQYVYNDRGKIIGKLISFNDITTIHNLNVKLNEKMEELEKVHLSLKNANSKILKHALTVEELAVTRERNRILSELHDSIGQAYTSNLALARCTETLLLSGRMEEVCDTLDEMSSVTKTLLSTITNCVNSKDAIISKQPLKDLLDKLFYYYRKSGLRIDCQINIDISDLEYKTVHNLYRICQESINNALKHGFAKYINISFEEKDSNLIMEILDDGLGCDSVYKGVGLKGMEYRAAELGGFVLFNSENQKSGFSILVEIPFRKETTL